MDRIIFLIFVLLIIACSKRNPSKEIRKVTSEKILGAWGNDENGNAIFQIDKDSILYVDPMTKYKYILVHDTLLMYQNKFVNKFLVLKVENDSLVVKNLNYSVIQRYNRRK